jgi:hypothetical protein
MPTDPLCAGGPYAAPNGLLNPSSPGVSVPTSPTDPLCASMPGYGVCQGGPFAPPSIPPPPPATAAAAAPPPDAPIAQPPDGGMPHDLGGMHDIGGMHAGGGRR